MPATPSHILPPGPSIIAAGKPGGIPPLCVNPLKHKRFYIWQDSCKGSGPSPFRAGPLWREIMRIQDCQMDISCQRTASETREASYVFRVEHDGEFKDMLKSYAKDGKIVFVCAVGQRSALACEFAAAAGLTRIYNIEGGTDGWIKAGYPVEK